MVNKMKNAIIPSLFRDRIHACQRLASVEIAIALLFAVLGAQAMITQTGGVVESSAVTNGNKVVVTSVYKFTDTETPNSMTFSDETTVDVLVVGGGGAGGCGFGGGGGGGGGVVYREGMRIAAGTYGITVGAGGAAGAYRDATSAGVPGNGGDSSVFGLTAIGGGHGGGFSLTSDNSATNFYAAATGGSGGGGGSFGPKNGDSTQWESSPPGAPGTDGQGNAGGRGYGHTSFAGTNGRGGGGGGAGVAGKSFDGTTLAYSSEGVTNSITGVAQVYGSGGGGGWNLTGENISRAGMNAGAGGIINGQNGQPGVDGYGGGGGGGASNKFAGGKGGSGVVIVRTVETYQIGVRSSAVGAKSRNLDGDYFVYTFTNSTDLMSFTVEEDALLDVLVVGGGGAGGCGHCGGGGGGGGVIYREGYAVDAGTYGITVGAGGAAGAYRDATSAGVPGNGGDSSVFGLTAIGGGHGGGFSLTSDNSATNFYAAATGGSGGGGGSFGPKNGDSTQWESSPPGAPGTDGQGNAGGRGYGHTSFAGTNGRGGGGGGAGVAGKSFDGTTLAYSSEGVTNSITGVAQVYGSGGGGGWNLTGENISRAGMNAGAGGIINGQNGQPGVDGYGGGGGGGASNKFAGGKGGSGTVIIRIHKPMSSGFAIVVR